MGKDNRRLWEQWVGSNIGGDEVRQRNALDAALQSLAVGKSSAEAVDAARKAVGAAALGVLCCRFCGSTPAKRMTVYEHNGYLILFTAKTLKGSFCRNCGLQAWRRMTNTTLLRGWLGVFSFFLAPLTVLVNLINRPKLASLNGPDPGSGVREPADPGPSLFMRPGLYVYAIVLTAVFLIYVLPLLTRS